MRHSLDFLQLILQLEYMCLVTGDRDSPKQHKR